MMRGGEIFERSKKMERTPEKEMKGEGGGLGVWTSIMREDFSKLAEEMRKGFREQSKLMQGGLEELRKEFRDQTNEWRREKEELKREIEEMKERMGKLEGKGKEEGREEERGRREEGRKIIDKVREMERRMEVKEKKERRRNVIIKGIEVKEGGRRERVEKILGEIGAKVEIEEVRRIGGVGEMGRDGEMVLVKLGNEEQKWEVMEKKKRLRGRKERITEDLTWKERRVRWRLGEIARKEQEEGKRVWIKGGMIRIGEKWWRWDEEEEKLKDSNGGIREEGQGEG